MKRAMLLLIALTGCGKAPDTQPNSDDLGSLCAAASTYAGVAAEIARYTGPASLIAPASVREAISFSRPTADLIDRDTGSVTCSADMTAAAPSGLYAVPAGLEVVPNKEPTVRLHYQIKKEAGTGRKLYEVADVEKISEFAAYIIFSKNAQNQPPVELKKSTADFTPDIKALIAREEAENEGCRGGAGDSVETMRACNRRQALLKSLQDQGVCWGGADIEAEKKFVACRPGDNEYSPGAFDAPYFNESEIAEAANGQ